MGVGSLRRYDVQASYALFFALGSLFPLAGAVGIGLSRYQSDLGQIVYGGSKGLFVPAYFGCVLLSMVCGGLGFVFGWSSAGEPRNDKQRRSWIGFFLGGSVVTCDMILTLAFFMLRFKQPV